MLIKLLLLFLYLKLAKSSCPDGSVEWQENCLIFNSNATGFAKAEITCNKLGGHLTSIHDAFANEVIEENAHDYFHDSTVTDFWVGGNTLLSKGNWSWTDGGTFDFNDWKKGEPQNLTGFDCVSISLSDGYWSSQECFKLKPFVCSISNTPLTTSAPPTTKASLTTRPQPTVIPYANCTAGWTYFEPSQSCYGGGYNYANWTTAENYCKKFGAHLPSIHSYEEIMFLHSFEYALNNLFWLGLYSVDSGNSWHYTDNSPVDYTTWDIQPQQNISGESCVILGWNDYTVPVYRNHDCNENWYTICKKPYP